MKDLHDSKMLNKNSNREPCLDMEKSDSFKQEKHRAVVLSEFRRTVQDILEPHHDDQFLLRWLIARDFDLIKAEKMIRENFVFRKKIGANSILKDYQLPEVYKKYPVTASLGFDKDNSSVRLFMIGICDYKGFLESMTSVEVTKLFVYFLEHDLNTIQERKKEGGKVDMKATYILDYTQFSLKKFYSKQFITTGLQILAMYQNNYPENLKAAYLVNVPSYFSFVFNIFKPFMNEVTLNKLKIYSTGEWKEKLRNVMDSKQIPAFWGGELTSPDGDPTCPHLINWNCKVDSSYFLKHRRNSDDNMQDPTLTTATIQQRGVLQVPVEVKTTGVVLKWTFMTKEYSIRFGLFLRRGGKSSRLEKVIPVEIVDCHLGKEENEFVCEKTGTYLLHFDNSYSWLTSKQVSYKVEVETIETVDCNN